MSNHDQEDIRCWLAKNGQPDASITDEVISHFEQAESVAVALEDYTWTASLRAADRRRLLAETREALDADPGNTETGADITDDISDADLFQKWMRS